METLTRCYLSMGSNLGPRSETLRRGLAELAAGRMRLEACSSLYETEPVGLEGPEFVNLACGLETSLSPERLHRLCLDVERRQGRRRDGRLTSRTLDIDLLYYGDRLIATSTLTVPHPRLAERNFVLIPLVEIAADFVDPQTRLSIAEMAQRCPDPSWVRRIGPPPDLPML